MSQLFGDDYEGRKAIPIFEGVLMYFPKAIAAIAEVSAAGNKQHNPGQPLHWARGKSMDQFNTALRHMMDHRMGGGRVPAEQEGQEINNGWRPEPKDKDGSRHLAKAAWRILAALELAIEEEEATAQLAGRATSMVDKELIQGTLPDPDVTRRCSCGGYLFRTFAGAPPRSEIAFGIQHREDGPCHHV